MYVTATFGGGFNQVLARLKLAVSPKAYLGEKLLLENQVCLWFCDKLRVRVEDSQAGQGWQRT